MLSEQRKKKLREEFLALHYEPEHQAGGACWCGVSYSKEDDGKLHINHKKQRDILWQFIISTLDQEIASKVGEITKEINSCKEYYGNPKEQLMMYSHEILSLPSLNHDNKTKE